MQYTTLLHSPSTAGGSIVTDKLTIHLDAGNENSFPRTSGNNQWKDIATSNSSIIGTLKADAKFENWDGGYIQFDGTDDWVDFATTPTFGLGTADFSICMWVRVATAKGTIIDFRNAGNAEGFSDYLFQDRFNTYSKQKGTYYSSDYEISYNNWVFVTYVRSGSNFSAYYNGNLDKTVGNANFNSWAENLRIGANVNGSGFHGSVAVVMLYKDKALSQAEITQNYNALKGRYSQ